MNRRAFLAWLARALKGTVAGLLALTGARTLEKRLSGTVGAPPGQHPLRPPGALPEADFRAACTRCFLCAQVCPVDCLRFPRKIEGAEPPLLRAPGALERPETVAPLWDGGQTPYVLPWERACTLCMECGRVCPTGAIQPLITEEPERQDVRRQWSQQRRQLQRQVRMGTAHIDRKICLPWTRTSWCGACLTACPYRGEAITVDHQGRPTVHPEHCVGCGLCVEVCPIRYKAIAVRPPFRPDRGEVRPE